MHGTLLVLLQRGQATRWGCTAVCLQRGGARECFMSIQGALHDAILGRIIPAAMELCSATNA